MPKQVYLFCCKKVIDVHIRQLQVMPKLELRLEKFSKTLAKDLFSEIERPAPYKILEIIRSIALLWSSLSNNPG